MDSHRLKKTHYIVIYFSQLSIVNSSQVHTMTWSKRQSVHSAKRKDSR